MKYITLHETTADFNAKKNNFELPHVAYVVETNTVDYEPYVPTPSHEYVDLGLPSGTKWATMNVGATSITDYGNYYQYGKGAAQYAATSGQSVYSGTESPLATTADTAAQEWGGNWHMPTQAQCEELTANTTYEWTTINGVNGGKFTATNGSGNYIFIPAGGYQYGGSLLNVGNSGSVWSSSPDGSSDANDLYFHNGHKSVDSDDRIYGYSVRPVLG